MSRKTIIKILTWSQHSLIFQIEILFKKLFLIFFPIIFIYIKPFLVDLHVKKHQSGDPLLSCFSCVIHVIYNEHFWCGYRFCFDNKLECAYINFHDTGQQTENKHIGLKHWQMSSFCRRICPVMKTNCYFMTDWVYLRGFPFPNKSSKQCQRNNNQTKYIGYSL